MIFGIFVNPRKEQVIEPLDQLDGWIGKSHPAAQFLLCTYDSVFTKKTYQNITIVSEQEILDKADVVLTLGGDGTILRSVQALKSTEIPILGINLGGLGFLADTAPEALIENLESFISGKYFIEKRAVLQCKEKNASRSFIAFNDLVIDKAGFSRVIEIITKVDGHLLNSYIADALILSTPSGSTGYSLSAGGPIVFPQADVIIINPICPHSLTNRPVVVPNNSIVTLKVFTEHTEINLFGDGQLVSSFPSGSEFEISKADYHVSLVKMKQHDFFETLRNKLSWGDDFRDKNRWSYNDYPST